MYTQCPECLSVFSLDAQTLAKAHGYVMCADCEACFDSLATLTEQLPPDPFVELSLNEPSLEPPRLDLIVYRPRPEPAAVLDAVAPATPARAEDFSQLVFSPRFAHVAAGRKPRSPNKSPRRRRAEIERRWPWVVACVLLLLLLVAQLGWAKRELLIRNPIAGAWLRSTCALLRCQLPLVSAPQQLRLLASNVQAHPGADDALMISASVRNDAPFSQPYPILTISLADADGHKLGMRRLRPREYLDDDAALQRGLAPGSNVVLLLELEDPDDKAVTFEFGFE